MLKVIAVMLAGVLAGYLMRRKRIGFLPAWIMVLIWTLLFVLGVEVGGNRMIVENLASIGLDAVIIASLTTSGSVCFALLLWRLARRRDIVEDKSGKRIERRGEEPEGLWKSLRGSIAILGCFATGIAAGSAAVLPTDKMEGISIYVLYVLMFSVGLSIGNDDKTLKSFRHINPILALLPLMTVSGTWVASVLCHFIVGRSLADCLAVGSGLGYYSLSSVLIGEAKGAELGAVALLSNVIREILTLTAAPLFARYFSPLAPIAAGGCTTADTTLPVITRASGKDFVVLSVYHGVVVDLAVPFMVSLFISL